jgi:hypothetical protein
MPIMSSFSGASRRSYAHNIILTFYWFATGGTGNTANTAVINNRTYLRFFINTSSGTVFTSGFGSHITHQFGPPSLPYNALVIGPGGPGGNSSGNFGGGGGGGGEVVTTSASLSAANFPRSTTSFSSNQTFTSGNTTGPFGFAQPGGGGQSATGSGGGNGGSSVGTSGGLGATSGTYRGGGGGGGANNGGNGGGTSSSTTAVGGAGGTWRTTSITGLSSSISSSAGGSGGRTYNARPSGPGCGGVGVPRLSGGNQQAGLVGGLAVTFDVTDYNYRVVTTNPWSGF